MTADRVPPDGRQHLTGVRLVLFDAVGTLIDPSPSVAEAYCRILMEHTELPVDAGLVRTVIAESLAERSRAADMSTSEQDESEFWYGLIRRLCRRPDAVDTCFHALFDHFRKPTNWRCFPDVRPVLDELQRRNITVAIGSNFDQRLHSVCDGLDGLAAVDLRFISSEIGWRKPAPGFFQAVMATTGIPAAEILMVGDDLTNDVVGAVASGCRAAWINRRAEPAQADSSHQRGMTSLLQLLE